MTLRSYDITFQGEAIPAITSAFQDFKITVDDGTSTLHGDSMDQPALYGAINRIRDLGLELLRVTPGDPDYPTGDGLSSK